MEVTYLKSKVRERIKKYCSKSDKWKDSIQGRGFLKRTHNLMNQLSMVEDVSKLINQINNEHNNI